MCGEFNDSGLAGDGKEGGVGGRGEAVGLNHELARADAAPPRLGDPDPEKRRAFHVFDPDRRPHAALVDRKQQVNASEPLEKPRKAVHGVKEGRLKVARGGHLDIPRDQERVVVGTHAVGMEAHGGSFPGM